MTVVLIALISGTASAQMPDSNDAQQVSDLPTGVQDPVIDEVRFSGLVRIDLATATARVGSKSGAKLDRDQVSKDIKRLFATSAFEDVQAWLVRETTSRGDQVLVLVYRVVERPAIESIKVEGAKEVKEEDVRKKIMVRTASILDVNRIRQSVDAIREHYVEQGFFLAEVDYKLVTRPENMVDVVFTIREHAKVKIQRVEFVGNNNIPSKELKKIIGTQEGSLLSFLTGRGTFAQEMFEQDLQRLEFYYNTKGFAEVRFDQPIVSLSRDRKFIQIVITVHEGPQYKVGEVSVEGDLLFAKEELMKGLALKSGEIFNAMNVQKDAMALSDKYKDLGYAFATVGNATNFRRDELLLDFTYVLQKGEKARFGRIEIIGNEGTRDWTIRREMRIYEGDLYNETKLRASEARIRRLGFSKVEIRPKATSRPDEVDVIVEVKERQTGAFSVGAGFSSVETSCSRLKLTNKTSWGVAKTFA